jgi:hypothetical protein
MRTSQWIRAGNGFEAVWNAIVWHTAIIWVPLAVIAVGGILGHNWWANQQAEKAQRRYEKTSAYAAEQAAAVQRARRAELEAREALTAPWSKLNCDALKAQDERFSRLARLGTESALDYAKRATNAQTAFNNHCHTTRSKP